MNLPSTEELVITKDLATQIRRDIIRMTHGAQSGHPGGSLGCADFFALMYNIVLNINKEQFKMDGKGEDMFFLSNGHISPVWYSTLARCTNYFSTDELATFRKIDSRLQGHPATHEGLPGIRIASGSLGQGLSVAVGAALSKKLNGDKNLVYTLMGDGEQQEGQIWEAVMFAAHNKVDNLIAFIDWNNRQIDGDVDEIMGLKDLDEKYRSFGWEVLECDGNKMEELLQTIEKAQHHSGKGKPVVIMMKTEMGQGVDFMMGTHKWHGVAPNDEQKDQALSQLQETLGDY
jgi:transketolase